MAFCCFAFHFYCVSIFHIKIQFSCIQISEEENHLKRIHRAVAVGKPAAIFMPKGKEDDMVLHITQPQEEIVRNLVRRQCANYWRGKCLLLEGLEERTCVQLLCSGGIFCRYFQEAVLPGENELYTQILVQNQKEE